jgi:hypothetical protein
MSETFDNLHKPTGKNKEFPGMTCRDIKLDHPSIKNGEYDLAMPLSIACWLACWFAGLLVCWLAGLLAYLF